MRRLTFVVFSKNPYVPQNSTQYFRCIISSSRFTSQDYPFSNLRLSPKTLVGRPVNPVTYTPTLSSFPNFHQLHLAPDVSDPFY